LRSPKSLGRRASVIATATLVVASWGAPQASPQAREVPAIVVVAIATSSIPGEAEREQLIDLAAGVLETLPR
jgi:hypothetical protein